MTALLRAASPALQAILGPTAPAGQVWSADLFAFTLAGGVTTYNWTSWDTDLTVAGVTYASKKPWITRSTWNVTNTMEVATLTVMLRDLGEAFAGGAALKTQIVSGLLDGASFLLSRAFLTALQPTVTVAGTLGLFGGVVGAIDVVGQAATIRIKGKNNILDQNAPRNLYQKGCNHAFCDAGCTLSRAAYTASFTVGALPTSTFIPWASAPSSPAPTSYQGGAFSLTGGAGAGQRRTIAKADSTGLTLAYPLGVVPAAGDGFTAFQGCSKASSDGSGQSCADHTPAAGGAAVDNRQNYRGFEYVPPPNAAY